MAGEGGMAGKGKKDCESGPGSSLFLLAFKTSFFSTTFCNRIYYCKSVGRGPGPKDFEGARVVHLPSFPGERRSCEEESSQDFLEE
jgi:hypothetical protein